MYEDYEFNAFDLDYTYDRDESYEHHHAQYEYDEDDYARCDSTDYQALAYMHYA